MARCRTYVRCPCCESRYSGEDDENHREGCPRPIERQLERLQMRQVVNTCPLCKGQVHVNNVDTNECLQCHAHWMPAWTQGEAAVEASTVTFRIEGDPMPMTQLPGKGSGVFTRRDNLAWLSEELKTVKAKFAQK